MQSQKAIAKKDLYRDFITYHHQKIDGNLMRSKTYQGIADAMADLWGGLV